MSCLSKNNNEDIIAKRIAEIRSKYSPEDIHFELLKRNEKFRSDWNETFPLKERRGILQLSRAVRGSEIERICRRWGLNPWAMGNQVEQLRPYIDLFPDLIFCDGHDRVVVKSIKAADEQLRVKWHCGSWPEYVAVEGPFIYVRINRWSRFEGSKIKREVERIQKETWGALPKVPTTFGRDLCWWDLHHQDCFGRRSAGQIRDLWKKHKQKLLGLNTIKAAMRNMQKRITGL